MKFEVMKNLSEFLDCFVVTRIEEINKDIMLSSQILVDFVSIVEF